MKNLIAGPSVYICDECIGLCNDIIAEEIEREDATGAVRSRLPEDSRALIAAVLDRGSSAAERVSSFTRDRERQLFAAIRGRDQELTREQFRRRFLEESAKARPSVEVLSEMGTLAGKWTGLHRIVGSQTSDSPPTEGQLPEWVRHITERLNFALEVLESLARRLEEPGFEPSRASLDPAQEKLDQARDLLMAGPPGPPVD